ncbi:TRAP transporter small permease [Puniceibacterium sediminis]|uniref:TRAP transporter small permease protein n=1 Tax=Puniceibacterium sediminis TaxID=1608407 RepID=A0A238XDS5_9RHOB|nr:TRAP transporter small permease subunit [Puniceibacterium sediminis]SNR56484.1 Tripartite ATP-independent transporter, DctQ component [Puniceibacterium sediminis]
MTDIANKSRTGWTGAAVWLITLWALLGGALLLSVVLMNVASILGAIVGNAVPGDFELTEIGVAVAVFAFLPYTQVTDANVTADIFTSGAGPRMVAFLKLLGALIALGFALLLLWRMYAGMGDQRDYGYTTTILQLPVWLAFIPILISLALLALAAVVSLRDHTDILRGKA